jgi:mono/diheme cytochrome c family protein
MKSVRSMALIVGGSLVLSALAFADVDKKSERLWKAKCASCHGQTGKGDTEKGKQLKIEDMTTAAYQAKSDAELKAAINDGVKSDMPSFKAELTPDQINAVVAYIRTFKK